MINSVLMDNIKILNTILKNNSKLKDISIKNDQLIYKNYSVDINKLNLNILFSNPYSKLILDIKTNNIYPENFFEIMKINSYKIEDDNNINNYDIINFEHFKKITSDYYVLSEKDFFDYNNFQKYIKLLLLQTTSDDTYLNKEQKKLLDSYLRLMQQMLQNNNRNSASNNYIKMIEDVNNEKAKRLKRSVSLEQKDGFANALLIILTMLITGIVIGFCGVFLV